MSLYLCSDGHDEIASDQRKCPICLLIEEHNKEISTLKRQIEHLQEELTADDSYKGRCIAAEAEVVRLCSGQKDGER